MKDATLSRAMFAKGLSKDSRNSGIMQGFEDNMEEDSGEEMMPMQRSPQNPEILMNNLRGDMRSVDARYQELAGMVGEEAAMETPPEVLALLQEHMAMMQQPQGIGALPQGQGMAPPQMPGQGAPMPMDQGQMPPQGGIPSPFPQGGAEQAPPTPDGMPPIKAAGGAFITPAIRAMQSVGPRLTSIGQAANQALGRFFMTPQPTLERVLGADGRPVVAQALNTMTRGPAGTLVPGVGTRMAPYTTMGPLQSPTFTQGLSQGMGELVNRFPALRNVPGLGLGTMAVTQALSDRPAKSPYSPETQEALKQIPTDVGGSAEEERQRTQMINAQSQMGGEFMLPPEPAAFTKEPSVAPETAAPETAAPADTLGAFITDKLAGKEKQVGVTAAPLVVAPEAKKAVADADKIRKLYGEYLPVFQELTGGDKDALKTQAMLLLADAGLRMAGGVDMQPGDSPVMQFSKSFSGLPKGLSALAAQAQEQGVKIKTAALQQALTDITAEKKLAGELQKTILTNDYRLLIEQAKRSGNILQKDAGLGGRTTETKEGSFLGFSIDPNDPTVKSALNSDYTLYPTSNPFVEDRGEAPTTVETNKDERIKLGNALRSIDNALGDLNTAKSNFQNLYSPGTWFSSKINNMLVPISGGMIRPDVQLEKSATALQTSLNRIQKSIASANDSGRVAVQEQQWVRDTQAGISDPKAFFTNKEIAAAELNSLEAQLRNARQQILTQLGYVKQNYVMSTPSTGTQSDPFVLSSDENQRKAMYGFLSKTIGTVNNPNALVYLKMPNGSVQGFNPSQLRSMGQ